MKKKSTVIYAVSAAVSAATFIVYLPALWNGFVSWDDRDYIFANPHIRSLDGDFFRWAFSAFYASNWHPLTWISHAVDVAVWGLQPLGHHLTNNLFHAANTFLVAVLVYKLLQAAKASSENTDGNGFLAERSMLIAAAATGLLFGLHPLHVESVAWASERKDLLCALFYLLSVNSYLNAGKSDNARDAGLVSAARRSLASLGFFVLALLSKPMAVTLPVTLLILDWYPLGRILSGKTFLAAFVEKLPFFALSLTASAMTILAQKAGGAVVHLTVFPLATRVLVAAQSLMAYLLKLVWPLHLIPFYAYPPDASLLSPEYIIAILFALGATVVFLGAAKKRKIWLAAWIYYVITLVPVLGIVQVGEQSMADRYSYLPSIAPFLVAGLGAAWAWTRIAAAQKQRITAASAVFLVALFIPVSLSYLTVRQIGIWKNGIRLWSSVIDQDPGKSSIPYYNRGFAFEEKGRFDQAVNDFNEAIAINAADYRPYNDLGVIYARSGMRDKAIGYFDEAVSLNPRASEAYNNRGITEEIMGKDAMALADYSMAIEFDTNNTAGIYFRRGRLYIKDGNKLLAEEDMRKACELGSNDACILVGRGYSRN